jgi:hypothetical protein
MRGKPGRGDEHGDTGRVGVTLTTLVVPGVAGVLGVEAVSALVARRVVRAHRWRNGLAILMLALMLWGGHRV